jgi:peptide methionine sulfoxide reductase msrA/msrB
MKRISVILAFLLFILASSPFAAQMEKPMERAILAGGCFWCVESALEQLDGVEEVISGYTGGETMDPTYKQVSAGITGHTEAVEVHFDPAKISYAELLDAFWKIMDPTDANGQFVDRGKQYRSGVFYLNDEQRMIAEASKQKLAETGPFKKELVTEITAAGPFYRAEEYHQDYYFKNPIRYKFYTYGSGRKEFVKKYWNKEM